jgi:hypothetical protein
MGLGKEIWAQTNSKWAYINHFWAILTTSACWNNSELNPTTNGPNLFYDKTNCHNRHGTLHATSDSVEHGKATKTKL